MIVTRTWLESIVVQEGNRLDLTVQVVRDDLLGRDERMQRFDASTDAVKLKQLCHEWFCALNLRLDFLVSEPGSLNRWCTYQVTRVLLADVMGRADAVHLRLVVEDHAPVHPETIQQWRQDHSKHILWLHLHREVL